MLQSNFVSPLRLAGMPCWQALPEQRREADPAVALQDAHRSAVCQHDRQHWVMLQIGQPLRRAGAILGASQGKGAGNLMSGRGGRALGQPPCPKGRNPERESDWPQHCYPVNCEIINCDTIDQPFLSEPVWRFVKRGK